MKEGKTGGCAGAMEADEIIRFLSQVVRGRIGGRKPATVTERIRAATVLLKLYQDGEVLFGDEEEDALSAAVRAFERERNDGRGCGEEEDG